MQEDYITLSFTADKNADSYANNRPIMSICPNQIIFNFAENPCYPDWWYFGLQ